MQGLRGVGSLSHHRCKQRDGVQDQPIRCTESRIEHRDKE